MELQIFQIPKTAMDELRILAARTGSEVVLLHESDLQRRGSPPSPQSEIANDPGPVDPAPQNQNIEWCCSQDLDLLRARVGHLLTSLKDAVP